MAGVYTNAYNTSNTINGYNNGAVTANLVLTEWVCPFTACRIEGITATAVTAGTGGGNTVLDVQKNGTSIYTTTANRPTLAAASTGEFTTLPPDTRTFQKGDRMTLLALSVSTTGHARVALTVAVKPV